MRIYISVDAEGMPGTYSWESVDPRDSRYPETRKTMTDITLFVCEELHKNGVDEVVVADSHDEMGNIYYENLPKYVSLIRGGRRPLSMVTGIDRKFDGAIFLGYHAAAGSLHASMDHTYTLKFREIRINGVKASEFYLNLLVASRYRVPVLLVGGDNVLEQDVKEKAPWIQYMKFKDSISRFSNLSPSMEAIKITLAEKVKLAIKNINQAKLIDLSQSEVLFVMRNTNDADDAEMIPGLQRVDAHTIRYEFDDIVNAYKMLEAIAYLMPAHE